MVGQTYWIGTGKVALRPAPSISCSTEQQKILLPASANIFAPKMMKKLFAFTLFALLMTASVQPANAQFLKKLFGRKDPERKPVARPATQKAVPQKKAVAKPAHKTQAEQLALPSTRIKSHYRIDVLAALYLNDLVKDGKSVYQVHIPDKVLPGLNFYEGVKLASDSLNHLGYNMDVYVHDITDPISSIASLINSATLDSSDLIIGAVGTQQIATLAAFALKHQVNFISTLSPSDASVKGNPYFTLLQPTLQTHCEALRRAIGKKYPRQKVLVYHRSTGTDEMAFKAIIKDNLFTYTPITANTLPTDAELRKEIDTEVVNVIVMPVFDAAYATQALQALTKSFPTARFEVYGMPSWKGMSGLKKEDASPNMTVYLTAPFYFDPTTASGQMITGAYKKTYGSHPGEMVYRGYETLTWYAYLLNRYGTIFNDKVGDNGTATFTRFDIKPRWDAAENLLYNENTHLYLYRYEGGNYSVEQ